MDFRYKLWLCLLYAIGKLSDNNSLPSAKWGHNTRGGPINKNCLLEGGPLIVQASLLGGCSRNPSVSMYQLSLLWESVFSFSEFFFEDFCNAFAYFTMGDLEHTSPYHWVFSSVWTKMHVLCAQPFLSTQSCRSAFFWSPSSPPLKKVIKGKCFADLEEMKQKMAEALKSIKIGEFKNCFEQWKKCFNMCIASNGEYFEGDWSLHM